MVLCWAEKPLILAEVDQVLIEEKNNPLSRSEILSKLMPYLQSEYNNGTKISHITKHLMGMFKGIQGAKEIRKFLVSLNQDSDPVSNFEFFMQKVAI